MGLWVAPPVRNRLTFAVLLGAAFLAPTKFQPVRTCRVIWTRKGIYQLAARADVIITAGLRPELFAGANLLKASRTLVITTMAVLVLAGFGLRVAALSAEGLSEDELNKLNAVTDYRQHGITSANGEHPMLMKTLQTISIVAAETLGPGRVSPETALRLPSAIFGALTIILI